MNKILFISYSWNLADRAGGIQSKRLYSGLERYFDVQVICRDFNTAEDDEEKKIMKVKSLNLFFFDRLFLFVFRFLRNILSIDQYVWCYTAYKKIKKENVSFDYIVTVHAPFTVRFLGFLLKKKYAKPLITFLFDPYSDNIYFQTNRLSVFLRRKVERKIVLKSDYLIFNNDIVYKLFSERYKQNVSRFFVLPLCCDYNSWKKLSSFSLSKESRNDKTTLIHAGMIHGKRNLTGLNEIVRSLKELDSKLSNTFQILLYGKLRQCDMDEIIKYGNDDVILIKGFITPEELLKEMQKTDGFIVIDAMNEDNICFPSKICDYFLFNKLIIGLTPQRSVTRDILNKSGHISCDESEYKQTAEFIYNYYKKENKTDWVIDRDFYKNFLPENIAKSLLAVING